MPASITLKTACPHLNQLELSSAVDCDFPGGVTLFRQGSAPEAIYLLLEGAVKLKRADYEGREFVVDLRYGESMLGIAQSLSGAEHPCTVTTVTPCHLKYLSRENFLTAIRDNSVLRYVTELLSRELLDQVARLTQVAAIPARRRLEHFLWLACENGRSQTNVKIQLPLKHWETAEFLSITPTYLSRLLSQLEVEGSISRVKGWIQVQNPASLWHDSGTVKAFGPINLV